MANDRTERSFWQSTEAWQACKSRQLGREKYSYWLPRTLCQLAGNLRATVNTRDGRLSGYVLGSLPTAGSWFTFPLEFLCNKSVPAEFFAAGICEGPRGNSEWLSLVIRNSSRALWVRAATGDAYGGNYFEEASAILADGLQRWRDGEEVVVAGIHAERLPTPPPKPLFADEIDEDSDRFRPGR